MWCVYRHTSPSNKTYVGITHYEDPKLRWGKDGKYYSKKTVFYKAIQKYGWGNIKHEVLFKNCSKEVAQKLEIAYIAYYKEQGLSYNMTIGGEGYNMGKDSSSKDYRNEQSRKFRAKNPDYDKNQYIKHRNKKLEPARKYYRENREKVLEYKKNNSIQKEKARLRAAKWRLEHPDYMKNYMKKYNNIKKESNE